ncbi:hypothetical protein [Antarcticimicrobium sediminis]|uniref:Outer membrane protein beta-barrel domain-containing protein n=1 Tax=Antarcticimicrobium sediminis TaxID=2546227 RepID=A0A4R5EVW7_9RHOB|nr:hypothetical protein [Antarcticimicrobium sediminis]TDE38982.1 hypothetical protein E1B25_08190 [Antarcticimicrobium sediminis]
MKFFLLLLGAFSFVSGCSLQHHPARIDYAVSVLEDDMHIIPPSLDTAGSRFLAGSSGGGARSVPASAAPASAASPPGFLNIDKDTLSSASGVAYQRTKSRKLQASVSLEKSVSRRFSVLGRGSVFAGKSRYFLPKGVGILVDPMTISFNTTGVEIEAGVSYHAGRRVESVIEVGGGRTFTDTRTTLSSALIRLSSKSSDQSDYVYTAIQVGLAVGQSRDTHLGLRTIAKYYPDLGGSVQIGLVYAF